MTRYKYILLVNDNTNLRQIGGSGYVTSSLEKAGVLVVSYEGEKPELFSLDCGHKPTTDAIGFCDHEEGLE